MTWFSLPNTSATVPAGFHDAQSATDWLAGLPQLNAVAMLHALAEQISAYNAYDTPARERLKTLEALRASIFAVSGACQRRFENRALPLLPAEQALWAETCRLWRVCALGYLRCLKSCLDQDETFAGQAGKVAHRALTCLRMEQGCCYAVRAEVDGECWHLMHGAYAAAEHLHVLVETVADALPRETAESTVSGLYGMALSLHLADPFALTQGQFAAVIRWLARWREMVVVLSQPPRGSHNAPSAGSSSAPLQSPSTPRWLMLDAVVRKLRKRREALQAGESPEALRLGNTLSAEACVSLLDTLVARFQQSEPLPVVRGDGGPVDTVWGIENIYGQLGGRALSKTSATVTPGGRLRSEQQAAFGLAAAQERGIPTMTWKMARQTDRAIEVRRRWETGDPRIVLGQLLALRTSPDAPWGLASVSRLCVHGPTVRLTVEPASGTVEPVVAEQRDRKSGQQIRVPGLMSAGPDGRLWVILPPGVNSPSQPPRLVDGEETAVAGNFLQLLARGSDHECWSVGDVATSA